MNEAFLCEMILKSYVGFKLKSTFIEIKIFFIVNHVFKLSLCLKLPINEAGKTHLRFR